MNAEELTSELITCVKARLPVMIKGAPGIGKTDIVHFVAEQTDHDMIVSHPVVSDPTEAKGQPWVIDGVAVFLPFGHLRQAMEAKKPTIWFFDDLGQAPAATQAAFMQLFLAREIDGKRISDFITFIAATNRRQDRAGVTGVLEPVKSRFATIIELTPELEGWINWAMHHEMPSELMAFMRFRPSLLWTDEATADIVNHPSPRTWAYLGKLFKAGTRHPETFGGAVGEGAAAEFVGFLRVYENLPDLEDILENPKKAMVPPTTEPAALYAVTAGLVELVTKKNSESVFTYGNRLPDDFSVLLVRDCIRKNSSIMNTNHFKEWAKLHKDVLF